MKFAMAGAEDDLNKPKSSRIVTSRGVRPDAVGAKIISPNLGCPEIVSLASLSERGIRVIIAAPVSEDFDAAACSLTACPSYAAERGEKVDRERPDQEFATHSFGLTLGNVQKLDSEAIPDHFEDVSETRLLISTTLRTELFPEHAFWAFWAKPEAPLDEKYLRRANGGRRSTLYDLSLSVGGNVVGRVKHALCLRPEEAGVRFVHLTDLHVAARNDLWEEEVPAVIAGSPVTPGRQEFQNFNGRVRRFIRWANHEADAGRLDFVLVLGDLVDFGRTGLFDRTADDSNWSTVIEILTGSPGESRHGSEGLRVPIFTTTGNHDWRPYPYSPKFKLDLFGITKECAKELDFWYRNTADEIGKKLEEVEQDLIRKGSPLLARSWWGAITGMGVRGLLVGWTRWVQRAQAVLVKSSRQVLWILAAAFLGIGSVSDLNKMRTGGVMNLLKALWSSLWHLSYASISQHGWQFAGLGFLLLALVLTFLLPSWLYAWLRSLLNSLIAIEAEVGTIYEYFLRVNPYFNYAFRVGNCYFILLDTGPDCLTAQSFWDEGGKKVRRITIEDNIIGGSPDSMSFYPANEFYPYSQISWLEKVLSCIGSRKVGAEQGQRIFVGLHAPPANLSEKDRKRADDQLQLNLSQNKHSVLMKKGDGLEAYDIHYGTVNHYLSQFFYLCLGHRESQKDKRTGPEVDVVFAGHAHWNLEFELRKPRGATAEWSPELWYGNFSKKVESTCQDEAENARWGPLLLQTAAGGPASDTAQDPPNFRYVTVNTKGEICHLRPCILNKSLSGDIEALAIDAAPARVKSDST